MSNEKMTPENPFNNGSFLGLAGCTYSGNQSIPVLYPNVTPMINDYQCIVCKFSRTSPTELHQHQVSVHTAEELSLSIIGLQILYNMNRSLEKKNFNKQINDGTTVLEKNVVNHSPGNNNGMVNLSASNLTVQNSIHPKLQDEPMCLKIYKQSSGTNTPENSNLKTQQKIAPKKPQIKTPPPLTAINKLMQVNQEKKMIHILPAISKANINSQKEIHIMKADYLKKVSGVPKITPTVNVYNQPLLLSDGKLYANQTLTIRRENFDNSQTHSICPKISPNNLVLNSNIIQYQTELPNIIIEKTEKCKTRQTFLKIPKAKLRNCEISIEKKEHNFKKPELIFKKPEVVKKPEVILKSEIILKKQPQAIVKKPENMKHPMVIISKIDEIKEPKGKMNNSITENQNQVNVVKVKDENFTTNLPLCNNLETVCLKRKRSKSHVLKTEPSLQNVNQSLEHFSNPESSLSIQESHSQIPELPQKDLEPFNKKFKFLSKSPDVKGKNMTSQNIQFLPIVEVIDDGWDKSVKEAFQAKNELPTDITKLAMQDSLNAQDIQNVSENSSYDDLTNEMFTQLDSYLMLQSLDDFNLNSLEIGMDNADYQAKGKNLLAGFDYSNEGDVILEINQPIIAPVEPSENIWINSDDNPTYTELLPVFQE